MNAFKDKIVRIKIDDSGYPERIKTILGYKKNGESRAPKHLDTLGNLDLLKIPSIGACGSRKASAKGLEIMADCATQIAQQNIVLVSGNANGVDFEAHFNSLKAGGKTIFVLPEGINYFKIKRAFASVWDWERVLVISQFEANEPWKNFRAMTRNRLIIALSRVIMVIEAGATGGTLNTGEETLKLNIPLFVAEYQNMTSDMLGNQLLIDQGANKLVKIKATNKANLTNIFTTMQQDEALQKSKATPQPSQISLNF